MKKLFIFACLGLFPGIGHGVAAEPAPTTGKVLVLDQDRILEGDIERVGNRFRIRHSSGETWIPATETMALVADHQTAYELLKKRANLNDADERYRLARWCLTYGLRQQALTEAEAAANLRPKDKNFVRMRDDLKQLAAIPMPTPTAPANSADPSGMEPGDVDVTPESLSRFVTKVQPILMNLCATCHATGHGGSFKLLRTYSNSALGQRATLANVASASAFINRQQPEASVLLVKAITAHGEASAPPIRDRQFPAYKHLDDWVRMALDQPLQNPMPPAAVATRLQPMGTAMPAPVEPSRQGEMPFQVVSPPKDATAGNSRPPEKPAPAMPPPPDAVEKPKTEPSDPFDPLIFNKQAHPEKK
jgi:hypothetical protein